MKKIGLVTFYDGNFGSILQCYATKRKLELDGYECEVIYTQDKENPKRCGKLKKLQKLIVGSVNDITYPYRWIKYRNKVGGLTDETTKRMHSFSVREIKPVLYSEKELKEIGKNSDFVAFIVGSDQVWNVSNEMSSIYRLPFTDREKRIAFAVSLGVEKANRTFREKLKQNVINFDYISTREKSGQKILEGITKVKVERIADPTLLFEKSFWEQFSSNTSIREKIYVLVHFLNYPNKDAIQSICYLSKELNAEVVCIGYYYDVFQKMKWKYKDCTPEEYIGYIIKSKVVCTDSYHTSLFSISLRKDFYTFKRMYNHGYPQNGRIKDLLENYNLTDRYIRYKIKEFEPIERDYDYTLNKEHMLVNQYLKKAILRTSGEE